MSTRNARHLAYKKQQQEAENVRKIGMIVIAVVVLVLAAGLAYTYWPKSSSSSTGSAKQWTSPPPMSIDTNAQYFAHIKLQKGGEIVIQLFADKAPITVNNFVFLAREGFYDGTTFHRVLEGFMAQGGDPTGTGMGGPGYEFQNEVSDLSFDKAGVVAMANAGPDTNGSQFFITFGPADWLNGGYTIFGQVVEGMDVVNSITLRDPNTATTPGDVIETITISEK
jgi:cyclophilin family peptidyl-prolyl cis-trans isomerase